MHPEDRSKYVRCLDLAADQLRGRAAYGTVRAIEASARWVESADTWATARRIIETDLIEARLSNHVAREEWITGYLKVLSILPH